MTPTGSAHRAHTPSVRSPRVPVALALSALLLAMAAIGGLTTVALRVEEPRSTASPAATASDQVIADAFENQRSGVQVSGAGVVERVLSDDNEGSRHQRFILRLASGQTLLFAHNIDIAPRLGSLAPGDSVAFNGVYEWNEQGGVVHWTHHDPDGQHTAGWLKHNGVTSQ